MHRRFEPVSDFEIQYLWRGRRGPVSFRSLEHGWPHGIQLRLELLDRAPVSEDDIVEPRVFETLIANRGEASPLPISSANDPRLPEDDR